MPRSLHRGPSDMRCGTTADMPGYTCDPSAKIEGENDLVKALRLREQATLRSFHRLVVSGDGHLGRWNDESCDSGSGEKRDAGRGCLDSNANANHS